MPNDWELNDDLPEEEVFFVDVLLPRKCSLMMLHDGKVQEQELCSFPQRNTFSPIPS